MKKGLLLLVVGWLSMHTLFAETEDDHIRERSEDIVEQAIADVQADAKAKQEDEQEAEAEFELSKDYAAPLKYVIEGITVSGVKYYNTDQVINVSELAVGDTIAIPSEQTSNAIKKLWSNGMFSDVKLSVTNVVGNKVYLDIYLEERPRIILYTIEGVKKSERDDLKEMLYIRRGSEYSEYVKNNAIGIITRYFEGKGFKNVGVDVDVVPDSTIANGVRVTFNVDKNYKIRVKEIEFEGNYTVSASKLRSKMKKVHRRRWYTFWWSSKYIQKEIDEDRASLISYYQELGYRDVRIVKDSVWIINPKHIGIKYTIYEGQKYYYRNISWVGNTKYPAQVLTNLLRVQAGDVYDKVSMEKFLYTDINSVQTLYMDQGHLFFNVQPVEVKVEQDSVDIEFRITEGKPAKVNNVIIEGNTKTNEHVIRRELWTRPGDLFSKTAIENSVRYLAQMGHFNPETLDVKPFPNPADETVDLKYTVEEKPNDQLELSGGYGNNTVVFTAGVRLSNFSAARMFDKSAWKPLPSGDNQQLALRVQTNGTYYKAVSASFSEPWLGGKKPTSLNTSVYYTYQNNANWLGQKTNQHMAVFGVSVGIGQRLTWPDRDFTLGHMVDYQKYDLRNWTGFMFSDGEAHNLSYKIVLGRNSTDQPIYPRRGSEFEIGLRMTPPYSLFNNRDYSDPNLDPSVRYRFIEYHKWTFRTAWYNSLIGDLVMALKMQFGYLGYYKRSVGYSPFEAFELGGDGMSGYNLYGADNIGLRGYDNASLTPRGYSLNGQLINMGHVYDKFTLEIRYPVILSPQSTIYVLGFLEAGNAWMHLEQFSPFSVKRSAGVGVRLMLPMVGLLGVDWAWGFDPAWGGTQPFGSKFHFMIGAPF